MDFVMKQALGGATKDMGKMLGGDEEKDPDAAKKEEERQEALRQEEEERKAKYAKMEAEREVMRQGIRDKGPSPELTASLTSTPCAGQQNPHTLLAQDWMGSSAQGWLQNKHCLSQKQVLGVKTCVMRRLMLLIVVVTFIVILLLMGQIHPMKGSPRFSCSTTLSSHKRRDIPVLLLEQASSRRSEGLQKQDAIMLESPEA
ncbi:PREDICTED: uncharacterized protein LOC104577695 [Tinamus guttatus]|uniref:uncharacterized protein LOC104577695 n=1 Tax=Tinamus guttatus TaxID=94827 RepID=UPI00052ED871|nr:PREDICTED: uncharacterized protein LOC104577695 [Tinamus guttatus]